MEKFTGRIRTNSKGYGFFRNESIDSFVEIPPEKLNTALDFDSVEVVITGKNNRGDLEGEVIRLIERDKDTWVGRIIEENDKHGKRIKKFKPSSFRFYPKTEIINIDRYHKIKENRKVLVKLVEWINWHSPAKIKILKVIGKAGEHETEMQSAVLEQGLPMHFPKEVEVAATKLKQEAPKHIEEDLSNRLDLRNENIFTIDPADAKDFDDALHIKKLENGNFEVGIHIADPTFFLDKNSIIDKEAQKRATSIYLVDRTIPMMPEVLSNELCSINPNEDKMAFSLIFELTPDTQVVNSRFDSSIINSKRRFNYIEAQDIIDKKEGDFVQELTWLVDLSKIMEKKRVKNGSIEFSSFEPKFKMDENMFPTEIYVKPRVRTMQMIEEFMLLANQEISKFISLDSEGEENKNPFIYRVHDTPKPERIKEVISFLEKLNLKPDLNNDEMLSAKEINHIIESFKGKPEEHIISLSILQSMQKAIYSSDPRGHFGLAFKYYTHFTSPIRRYPDDIAHRLVKRYLKGEEISQKEKEKIQKLSEHCSVMEQKAVAAERDSIAFKYAQYYSVRIGEKFSGIITGMTKFGFFVEEKNTKAQGLVNVRNLGDDFFEYDDNLKIIIGQNTKQIFKIGQFVDTKLIEVDIESRRIDLALDGVEPKIIPKVEKRNHKKSNWNDRNKKRHNHKKHKHGHHHKKRY